VFRIDRTRSGAAVEALLGPDFRGTVVASCRQQGRPVLAFLVAAGEAALRGSPPPSLLSAPRGS